MKYLINIITIILLTFQSLKAQTTNELNVTTGGSLQTHPGSQMGIFGDLNNDGSFTENQGEVGFYNQDDVQNITGNNAPEISDLIVGVPNDLNIEVNTIINTGVIFNDGRIITPRRDPNISLDLVQTDLYLNEGNDTHVDGYNSYTGNNAYTFPVGDEFRFRPLSIEALASQNTSSAAYFLEDPNTPTTFNSFNRDETENNITSISAVEFWDLDGDIETRVTLTWDILSNINSLINDNDLTELRVVGWSIAEQRWIDLGNTNFTNNTQVGQITSTLFTPNDFEIITFGGPGNNEIIDDFEDIQIFNAISANGDNDNSHFEIRGINKYPNNNLKIFNRWGVIVFEVDGYEELTPGEELDPDKFFIGKSNGRLTINKTENLPTATYFYILNFDANEFGSQTRAGYLYLQN